MSEVCDSFAGPHTIVHRIGNPSQPRPKRARLPTWRENALKQAQIGHQIQTEEGTPHAINKVLRA